MTDETVSLHVQEAAEELLAQNEPSAFAPIEADAPTYILDEIDADLDEVDEDDDFELDLSSRALTTDSLQLFLNEAGRTRCSPRRRRSSSRSGSSAATWPPRSG